ncbi:MAG: hypothetical protein LBN05_03350 [Oscillospiraceae bacterium]|jgi:ethanolamine utilization cobalamin adenosyltransferase|nr:hypothetical protein [Oscillospiraceae bacterium]
MALLTEESLRALRLSPDQRTLCVAPGTVCSPSALDFLAVRGISLVFEEAQTHTAGQPKPEHLTHLRGDILVPKTHPVIAFRGEMDALIAALTEASAVCGLSKHACLCAELAEITALCREILRCEVTETPFVSTNIAGKTLDEYRAMSHDPQKHFGLAHPLPTPDMPIAALRLNTLRTLVRRAELAAARAFLQGKSIERTDILTALNRLSSVLYVLYLRELSL